MGNSFTFVSNGGWRVDHKAFNPSHPQQMGVHALRVVWYSIAVVAAIFAIVGISSAWARCTDVIVYVFMTDATQSNFVLPVCAAHELTAHELTLRSNSYHCIYKNRAICTGEQLLKCLAALRLAAVAYKAALSC
jgi:hypothetical protein